MEKAGGKYMTFLAADDFLLPDALAEVRHAAERDYADVIWIENKFLQYADGRFEELGEAVPQSSASYETRNAENIKHIMESVFYNSFFHYERVEFLRDVGINFFSSYYGDCAGMTKALTEAEKMIVLNKPLYGLTVNTSQSRGTFYWDGDQYIFTVQWECIKMAYIREHRFSFQELKYCAMAVLKNEIGNIVSMAEGSKCVDRFMHPLNKHFVDRLIQIKQILENRTIQEMVPFYGRIEYEREIITAILSLCRTYSEEIQEETLKAAGWLGALVEVFGKDIGSESVMNRYMQALCCVENTGMFGIGMFLQEASGISDRQIQKCLGSIQQILEHYQRWKTEFTEELCNAFWRDGDLEERSKIELAAFCKYILDN